jgi:hypothetical protein
MFLGLIPALHVSLMANSTCTDVSHLQKELAELWAASKQQTPSLASSQHQQPSQHQLQQQPLLQEALAGLDSARKSNDKRKFSSERKPSSDLSGSGHHKGSEAAGGSQDSGVGPWGVQESHGSDQDSSSACSSDSVGCLRWLPYKVRVLINNNGTCVLWFPTVTAAADMLTARALCWHIFQPRGGSTLQDM